MNRRKFLKYSVASASTIALGAYPFASWANNTNENKLTILHTNDVHSRIDPFPENDSKYPNMGGVAQRKILIDEIKKQNQNTLLLDAGDMFQGTPYFNFFKGEAEIKAMNILGYDAGTLGNHDFDLGMENLATQLSNANFNIVNCNYNIQNTPLVNIVKPYIIKKIGKLRIGITGLGIDLEGLVPEILYKGLTYQNPLEKIKIMCDFLKHKKRCDMIICLSHLGYNYKSEKVCDVQIAKETKYLDVLLGGHTHTFLEQPDIIKNVYENNVIVNQVGFGGLVLGKLDFDFYDKKNAPDALKNSSGILVK